LQREDELRHAIKHGAWAGKLAKAAEGVRAAKLDVGKALEFAITQKRLKGASVDAELKDLKREIARWESMFTIRSSSFTAPHLIRRCRFDLSTKLTVRARSTP
jgi:cytosine/adenosine deaminase-related metal-dependent hydrolase